MRQISPSLSSEELDRWLGEAGIRVETRDRGRLHARLDAVRDRLRAALPQQRTAQLHAYVRDLAAPPPRARPVQVGAPWRERWRSPLAGIAAWAVVTWMSAAASHANPSNAFTAGIAVWAYPLPALGILGAAAHAGVECGRVRLRSGRGFALLGSVIALALAAACLHIILDAHRCSSSGFYFMGAIAVGMGGLAGIVSVERGRRDWWVAPEAVVLAVPFAYLHAILVLMCQG